MLELSQETEALAKRLAVLQRLSIDDAVKRALEEHARNTGLAARLIRDPSPEAIASRRAKLAKFVAELAAMPVLDPRSPQEIADDLDPL
jgi:antitoxin VapB